MLEVPVFLHLEIHWGAHGAQYVVVLMTKIDDSNHSKDIETDAKEKTHGQNREESMCRLLYSSPLMRVTRRGLNTQHHVCNVSSRETHEKFGT